MSGELIEKHQLAGLDERTRGFSRLVEITRLEGAYRVALRYEATHVVTEASESTGVAISELVRLLQARGYTQLRSRLSFDGMKYLGSQESWVEYPDPARPAEASQGRLRWFTRLFRVFKHG